MILREPWRERPPVVNGWIVFCFVSAALALLVIVFTDDFFRFLLENDPELKDDPNAPARMRIIDRVIAVGLVFTAAFMAVGPFLPRRDSTWIFAAIQMALSLVSGGCCCIFGAAPVLCFWFRPEVRAWFRGEDAADGVFLEPDD